MKSEHFVPVAILFAGALLAYSVYTIRHHATPLADTNPSAVRPVSVTDHTLGDPAAPVVIVEYADIESEYSKQFQQVMEQVIQNYASTGKVAWVYRHIPADEGTDNSQEDAEAAECVSSLSGTANFFKFIDAVQAAAPGDDQFNPSGYDAIVSSLGLSSGTFDDCVSAHTYLNKVEADYNNAAQMGAAGVPFSVLLVKGQEPHAISGYLSYTSMKAVIDQALAQTLSDTTK